MELGLGSILCFVIYRYWFTDPFGFLLLYRYLNVWFVKCDTHCVTYIFIVYFSTWVISFHSMPLSTPPVTQGAHLFIHDHKTLAFSLHGHCSICNTVDDNDAVSTLLLNTNPLAFYNYTISLCFLHPQRASLLCVDGCEKYLFNQFCILAITYQNG